MPVYTEEHARSVDYHLDLVWQGEAEFFARFAPAGEPILELACGALRVTRQLALLGYEVFGLDMSLPMLEKGREELEDFPEWARNRIHLAHGDMRNFNLGRSFSLVIISYYSFWFNLDYQGAEECVTCIRKHLSVGGRFIVDSPGSYEIDTWWPAMSRKLDFSIEVMEYPIWFKPLSSGDSGPRIFTALVGRVF